MEIITQPQENGNPAPDARVGLSVVGQPAIEIDYQAAWEDMPLLLGPTGDAYRMAMVGGNGLLLVAPPTTSDVSRRSKDALLSLPWTEDGPGAGAGAGIWRSSTNDLVAMLYQANRMGRETAQAEYETSPREAQHRKALSARLAYFSKENLTKVDDAVNAMRNVLRVAGATGQPPLPIRTCEYRQINGDVRYIGMLDGVWDTQDVRLLTGAEAADKFVTITTGSPYQDKLPGTEAERQKAGQLAAQVWTPPMLAQDESGRELMRYVQDSIAYAMYGKPDHQALNLLIDAVDGRGNAGKTTFLNAVCMAVGEYGGPLDDDVLRGKRREGGAGRATPELKALTEWRIGYIDEANSARIGAERFKSITGTGQIVYRELYGNPVTATLTCSIFADSNEPLRIDLSGNAEFRRYRPMPWPEIPPEQRNPELATAFTAQTTVGALARRELLLLILDRMGEIETPPHPPPPPQVISDLAEEHRQQQLGAEGEWIRQHILLTPGEYLPSAAAYTAFAAMEPKAAEQVTRQQFTSKVGKLLGIAAPRNKQMGRKQVRCWAGAALSPEAQAAGSQALINTDTGSGG